LLFPCVETCRVWPCEKKAEKSGKQNPSSIWKKVSYTLEDGHVGRNK
jgi:hypothetical protein